MGELEVTLLKMLMSTRKMVTRSVILPGTISGGMRKLTQDTDKRMRMIVNLFLIVFYRGQKGLMGDSS